jgi:lipoprotein-releasing system ATP-binding protein
MPFVQDQNALFKIENLRCRYSEGRTVLQVQDLVIERGKTTAILGLSGIGKSTILETLGLMNKTMPRESKILFYPDQKNGPYDYSDLWYKENETIRSQIRREHFSFIFQEHNLMHNFSALDNICLTLLLQNLTKAEAIKEVMTYVYEMELGNKISDSTMISNLSGGERQRLSFIRAIAPDFTVLFGDEPTGNLDVLNASRVMQSLGGILKTRKKSSIIVTHDVSLSLNYADDIILIEEREEESSGEPFFYGFISGNNVFRSELLCEEKIWKNHLTMESGDSLWITNKIMEIFKGAQKNHME